MAENTIPQAAAETISAMLESDGGFKEALERDPMAALASIGLGGTLAAEIAHGLASNTGEVSGYILGCSGWTTSKGCDCTKFVAECMKGTKAVKTGCSKK